ncbi:MAG: sulfatase [Polyangiaceae bacterium]|nr:sulfatase [Polyangiaceae bacterium]
MDASVARAGIGATIFSLFTVAVAEALWPVELVLARPSIAFGLFAHVVTFGQKSLKWSITYGVAVIVVEVLLAWRAREKKWPRIIVHGALAAALCVHAYLTLLRYEVFKDHPVLVVPYVVAFGLITALGVALGLPRFRRAGAALGLGSFLVLHGLNHFVMPDSYFTFHLSLLELSLPILILGATHTLLLLRFSRPRVWRVAAILALGVLSIGPWAAKGVAAPALPQALLHTLIGRLQVVYAPFTEGSEGPPVKREIDPDGVARFRSMSAMPALPEAFRLKSYNVVFITSEAVRFDKTSLADESQGTTPNLLKLAQDGGFSFTAAHSPSSATLPSNAAMMAMTYPSATRLDAWSRSWCGELSPDETTVAEHMSQAGYTTFRVTHDFHYGFTDNLLGFDQGFSTNDLFPEATEEEGMTLVKRIADRAAALIRENKDKRFFAWVYFASPHEPYYARYDDMPKATDADKYRQELRFMDEGVGTVVEALKEAGVYDDTIVIFVADHGEELGEHGGRGHKTLYEECTHVPFVVRIPRAGGGVVEATTSTLYVFPWLFLADDGPLYAAAERRLIEDIGPMLKATDGAAISELVAYDKMSTALAWADKKIVYNFIADAATAYDLSRDPKEKHDLMAADPDAAKDLLSAVRAYRDTRRGMRKYTINPKKKPSHAKLREANAPD